MQCSAVKCNAVHCSAVHCSALQYSALHYSSCSAVQKLADCSPHRLQDGDNQGEQIFNRPGVAGAVLQSPPSVR